MDKLITTTKNTAGLLKLIKGSEVYHYVMAGFGRKKLVYFVCVVGFLAFSRNFLYIRL